MTIKAFRFPVSVRWRGGRLTRVSVAGKPSLEVATPPEFRGAGGGWKGVVVEGLLEDRRVDQAERVLAGAQAGCLDHRLDPAAGYDDAGGPRRSQL